MHSVAERVLLCVRKIAWLKSEEPPIPRLEVNMTRVNQVSMGAGWYRPGREDLCGGKMKMVVEWI